MPLALLFHLRSSRMTFQTTSCAPCLNPLWTCVLAFMEAWAADPHVVLTTHPSLRPAINCGCYRHASRPDLELQRSRCTIGLGVVLFRFVAGQSLQHHAREGKHGTAVRRSSSTGPLPSRMASRTHNCLIEALRTIRPPTTLSRVSDASSQGVSLEAAAEFAPECLNKILSRLYFCPISAWFHTPTARHDH